MPELLPFSKMQGIGNDFVIVDARRDEPRDWSPLAQEICSRRFGVGADGLLVLENTNLADIRMRMFNPDGTPDVCGNGLRCVARFAVEKGITQNDTLTIATLAGVRDAMILRDSNGRIDSVKITMGEPRFKPEEIPALLSGERVLQYGLRLKSETLPITALSTGSAHAVTFAEALPEEDRFLSLSRETEMHPIFPERISLMWCMVTGLNSLRLRIWERGVGETLGCGTGACAAAVAAILNGKATLGSPIFVESAGGILQVLWEEGRELTMTGPAENVYEGVYPLS